MRSRDPSEGKDPSEGHHGEEAVLNAAALSFGVSDSKVQQKH